MLTAFRVPGLRARARDGPGLTPRSARPRNFRAAPADAKRWSRAATSRSLTPRWALAGTEAAGDLPAHHSRRPCPRPARERLRRGFLTNAPEQLRPHPLGIDERVLPQRPHLRGGELHEPRGHVL